MADAATPRDSLAQAGLSGGAFERAVYALLVRPDPVAVLELVAPGLAVVRFTPVGNAAVLVAGESPPPVETMAAVGKALRASGVELCIVSDDKKAVDAVNKSLPFMLRGAFPTYRFDSAGTLHGVAKVPLNKGPLHRALSAPPALPSAEEWARLHVRQAEALAAVRAQLDEDRRYVTALTSRWPVATYGIAAVIALVYGLELALSLDPPIWALRRLGALDAQLVQQGQWWRLLSCTFLHGGTWHILFNGIVLLTLGATLERVLGTPRFVVLYGLSAVVGSVVSLARLGDGASVGASGALWGMLAAEAVLLYHRRSPLPSVTRLRARQTVMVNLGINVLNSFRPHVDWAAHLGGALAGVVVILLFLSVADRGRADARTPHASALERGVAWLLGAAAAASVVAAVVTSQAWLLLGEPRFVAVPVPALRLASVEVPVIIASSSRETPAKAGTPREVVFGEIRNDPLFVGVSGEDLDAPMNDQGVADEVAGLVAALAKPAAGATVERKPEARPGPGGDVVATQWKFDNGMVLEIAVRVAREQWWRVEVVTWPDETATWHGTAERVARSVTPSPGGAKAAP